MRVRRMGRWVAGLVAVAAFGVAAAVSASTASAEVAEQTSVPGSQTTYGDAWD